MRSKIAAVSIFIGLALGGVILGVQYVGSSYSYHPGLGAPLVHVGGIRVYSPLKLLSWGEVLGTSSSVLQVGQMIALGGVVLGLLLGFGTRLLMEGGSGRLTRNVFGDAAFATLQEIRAMKVLGIAKGVFLGKTEGGEFIRHNGPEHYAVIAPTRSGKGAGIVIPTLLAWSGSCVVYDLKGENFHRTAGRRSQFSDIYQFNPNVLDTAHFNPLQEIRQGIFEVRDAQNLATMIIEPDRPGAQDHWIRTGNSLLTAAILHTMYAAPREEKNLAGVSALLSRPEKNLTDTLFEMLETKHLRDPSGRPAKPHPGVVAAVRDVLNKSPDDRSSVVSTVMGYLGIYRDPLLANATRDSDFSIDDLVNDIRPKSLYIVIPAGDIDRLRPIIRIMVNLICRRLTEQAVKGGTDQEHKHRLLLMLDEFTKLGRLEFFESALGFLAGYGIKAMLVTQSLAEIRQVYGERTSLLDNSHVRVFYRPETVETAEYISKTLGQTTVEYKTQGETGKKGAPFFSGVSQSLHVSSRPLLTPREVMELPEDEALVLIGGNKPIRAKKIRYFDDGAFLPLLSSPPKTTRKGDETHRSVWFEERFSPPEDWSQSAEGVEEGQEASVEVILTGFKDDTTRLQHPAHRVENTDIKAIPEEEDLA